MVTWGQDTVHTYVNSTPAPAPGSFFAAAPAAGGSGLFGAPAAPAAGAGLFGNTSTPAPGTTTGGLFGASTTTSTTTGGLFGSAPSGAGLFGSAPPPGGSLFGSATPAAQQQQQQQQQYQIPAQVAMQAHMDATARNEQERVVNRMHQIHEAYGGMSATTGATATTSDNKSHCFSTVVYNPTTPQQRQMQAVYSSMVGGDAQIMVPPRPAQISQDDWNRACIRNPDLQNYTPVAIVGAESLEARAILHQEQANAIETNMAHLQGTASDLQDRQVAVRAQLARLQKKHQEQLVRLLKVMRFVEVARCFNLPQQQAEWQAQQRIVELKRRVGELIPVIARLSDPQLLLLSSANANNRTSRQGSGGEAQQQRHQLSSATSPGDDIRNIRKKEQEQHWKQTMTEHRDVLTQMTSTVQQDSHDLQLIRDRVLATETVFHRPPAR